MQARAAGAHQQGRLYRFPPELRLRRAAEFEAVFKKGRRSADEFFTVLYRPSALAHARLGLATPARRIRSAVARNRLRRLVRESFRQNQQDLVGLDIVVLARTAAVQASNAALGSSLAGHWSRLQRSITGKG